MLTLIFLVLVLFFAARPLLKEVVLLLRRERDLQKRTIFDHLPWPLYGFLRRRALLAGLPERGPSRNVSPPDLVFLLYRPLPCLVVLLDVSVTIVLLIFAI